MNFTAKELDMARKGYVYFAKVEGNSPYRKRVSSIEAIRRADLVFDWPAYEAHNEPR